MYSFLAGALVEPHPKAEQALLGVLDYVVALQPHQQLHHAPQTHFKLLLHPTPSQLQKHKLRHISASSLLPDGGWERLSDL